MSAPPPPPRNIPKRSNPPPPPVGKQSKRPPMKVPTIPIQQPQQQQQQQQQINVSKTQVKTQQITDKGNTIGRQNKDQGNINDSQQIKNVDKFRNKQEVKNVREEEVGNQSIGKEDGREGKEVIQNKQTQIQDMTDLGQNANINVSAVKMQVPLFRGPPPAIPKKVTPSRPGANKKGTNITRPPPPIRQPIQSAQRQQEQANKIDQRRSIQQPKGKQSEAIKQPISQIQNNNQEQVISQKRVEEKPGEVANQANKQVNNEEVKQEQETKTAPQPKRVVKQVVPPPINTKKAPKAPPRPAYNEQKSLKQQQQEQQKAPQSAILFPSEKTKPQPQALSSIQSSTPNRSQISPGSASKPAEVQLKQLLSPKQQVQAIMGLTNLTPKYSKLKDKIKDFEKKKEKLLQSSSQDSNSEICSQTYSQVDVKKDNKNKQIRGLYTAQSVRLDKVDQNQGKNKNRVKDNDDDSYNDNKIGIQLNKVEDNQWETQNKFLRTQSENPFIKQNIENEQSLVRNSSQKNFNKFKEEADTKIQKKDDNTIKNASIQQTKPVNGEKREQKVSVSQVQAPNRSQNIGKMNQEFQNQNNVILQLEQQNNFSPVKQNDEVPSFNAQKFQIATNIVNPFQDNNNDTQVKEQKQETVKVAVKPIPPPMKKQGARRATPAPVPPRTLLNSKNKSSIISTKQPQAQKRRQPSLQQQMNTQNSQPVPEIPKQKDNSQAKQTRDKPAQPIHTPKQPTVPPKQPQPQATPSSSKSLPPASSTLSQMSQMLQKFNSTKQSYLKNAQQLTQICERNRQLQNKKILKVNQLLHRLEQQNIKLKSVLVNY